MLNTVAYHPKHMQWFTIKTRRCADATEVLFANTSFL